MQPLSIDANWIDLVVFLILLLALFNGWRRGFLAGFFDLFGFLAAFLLALRFYSLGAKILAAHFTLSLAIAKAVAFFAIAIIAEIAIAIILGLFHDLVPQKIAKSTVNRFFGFFPALGETLILTSFVLSLVLTLPVRGEVKSDILSSKLGNFLVGQTQGVENQLSQILGGAVEETLNFFTIKPESEETVDLKFTQKELSIDQASEKTMFDLVNSERENHGLRKLIWDEQLQVVARMHAKDMFERGYFSHYNPEGLSPADRLEAAGIGYTVTGENLALAPNVEIAHRGLMESPGHRDNILSIDYGRLGMGVLDGGIYGEMFVQEFTN